MRDCGTGLGTTPDMWKMVSDALDGELLPESINKAINALCDGNAFLYVRSKDCEFIAVGVGN